MAESSIGNASEFPEKALIFPVNGKTCLGVFHAGTKDAMTGVLIVVGGRQYRVGAHRQFVSLARDIAAVGFHVLRFDMRGMGDSDGDARHFLDTGDDLRAALDMLKQQAPEIERVVVWGLCDGATAAIVNLGSLPEVQGLMLINPWVSTDQGSAKVFMKHYYLSRLFHADFWKKLVNGKLDLKASASSLANTLRLALLPPNRTMDDEIALPAMVLDQLEAFDRQLSIVISEKDLTAMEFLDALNARNKLMATTVSPHVPVTQLSADHTFSGAGQYQKLANITMEFVQSCDQRQSSP